MSRFNAPNADTVANAAGGLSHTQTPELELISILLTSFANEQFYRSSNDTFERLKTLIQKLNFLHKIDFVARAAIYARTQFGMRSITHVVASELAKYVQGKDWASAFYNQIIYRPDDMMEILAYHTANNGKVTNAMKKGFGAAFGRFDAYQLAKYRGESKSIKLVDVANLVHPAPTDKNREALAALIKGELKSTDTWESKLTTAGQNAESQEEKEEFKKEAWTGLITERKIGYFALLRNLRNIIEQAPEILPAAIEMLTDSGLIAKSLVLPFRFQTAAGEIGKLTSSAARIALVGINKALDISVSNAPVFDGETLVVLDVSGSMEGRPSEIGALFAAVLIKSNNADFMVFANDAGYLQVNPLDSTTTISKAIRFTGGGTNFHSIFMRATRKYDRIIILSDMQGWIGYDTPVRAFNDYCQRTGADPYIYSFDLQNYGSMQFPQRKVFCLAGFSEKVFDIMKLLEQDKNALVNAVNEISL